MAAVTITSGLLRLQIYGAKDADGFYVGESSEGRRGMVPFNMVSEVHVDSPDVAERLLRDNTTAPPPPGSMYSISFARGQQRCGSPRDNTTTPPGPPSSRHAERGASRPPVGARSGHPPRHHRTGSLHRCTAASSSSSSQRRRVAKAAL